MARTPASPALLLQEMLSPENDVRRCAEVQYEDWLDADPDACAAGLLQLCCDGAADGARLLAFTLLRRVVAKRWPGLAVDVRRAAAGAVLAQALAPTADRASTRGAVEVCAALVQQGLGLDDADEDANTVVLERALAAPGHAAALKILERTIQEASPRVLGARFPRVAAALEAGLASDAAVPACRAALALCGEVESQVMRQHVAQRLVPKVAAVLTTCALAGDDDACSAILTVASALFDEPLVSWTSFLPAKARALFDVPGAAESLADACGACVSSHGVDDAVRALALEVLASLLEAAAYWRRAFSFELAAAVAPLAARAAARGFRSVDDDAWATRQRARADDDDADDDTDDAETDLEAYAPLAATAASTLARAANVVGSSRLLGAAVAGAVTQLASGCVEEKRAACLVVEVLARDADADDVLDEHGVIVPVLADVAAGDADAVVRDRAFRCLSRLCLAAQPGRAPDDDDDEYWAGFDDDGDRLRGPITGRSFAQAFPGVFSACGATLDVSKDVRVATEAALLLARCCEPHVGAPPPDLEAALSKAALDLLAACLPPVDDAKLACGARCALALGRLAAVVRSPAAITMALGAALRTMDGRVPTPFRPERAPCLANLVGRLIEAHALSAKACAVAGCAVDAAVAVGSEVCASLLTLGQDDDGASDRALRRRVLAASARYCDAALSGTNDALRIGLARRVIDEALRDGTRRVACDVFTTLRAARQRGQDQADFEVVTCVSTKESIKYMVIDAGRLQTNEVAFRSIYEVVKRRRNAQGLDAVEVAGRICAALQLEWIRFAPTLVAVAAGALSCLAAAADVFQVVAPCLCGQIAALNDRCGGAELVSYDADADASEGDADASRAGALRAVEALSLVCEALRDALTATRAPDSALNAARALSAAAEASCARRREARDLAEESEDDDADVGSAAHAERDLLECCSAGLTAALRLAPVSDVVACVAAVAGPHLVEHAEEDALHRELRAWAICLAAEAAKHTGASEPLARACVAAATSPHASLRQAGAWALGVLAEVMPVPDAAPALINALAAFPRDGACGASDMAFENIVAAAFRVYAQNTAQDQLAMAAFGGLPLYLDLAEARPAHATAWALLPDADARRGLAAALAQVAAARPPPPWAVAVLSGERRPRVVRRYGGDAGAARAAAQKAVDDAAVVDAATQAALGALV